MKPPRLLSLTLKPWILCTVVVAYLLVEPIVARRSSGGSVGGGRMSSGSSGSSGRYGGGLGSSSATRYGSSSGAGFGSSSPLRSSSGFGGASATRYGSSSGAGVGATRYGSSSGSKIGTGTALGAGAAGGALGTYGATRLGGGSFGSSGARAGLVGSGTRYGSQSSTGGIFGSSGAAGATRYGSSAPSGRGSPTDSIRNRFSGSGVRQPVAGNARPNYGFGSSNTLGNRPAVNTPRASASSPSKVVYSPTYNTYNSYGRGSSFGGLGSSGYGGLGSSYGGRRGFGTGSMIATGLAAGVGGYYLGRAMGSLYRPYGFGYGYPGMGYGYGGYGYGGMGYGGMGYGGGMCDTCSMGGYVPYRDRYRDYYPTDNQQVITNPANNNNNNVNTQGAVASVNQPAIAATEAPQKSVDLCMLARWNRELPFAELPNMALDFLATNLISGNTTSDKAKFMYEFLTVSVEAYEKYNSSADIFTIPASFDINTCNIKVSKTQLVNAATAVQQEEPIMTSLRHMLSLYSNKSTDADDLTDVVNAAKACLPQGPNITNPEVLPCIDFSLSPDQMLKLETPHSMFGSAEICRRQLSPDMFKCVPKVVGNPCKMEHLATLNLFARNFYLCSEAIGENTVAGLEAHSSGPAAGGVPSVAGRRVESTTSSVIAYVGTGWVGSTTAKPGFWSRIFG
ncbi:hypothetical protein RvY_00459-2 [Ramazzottius varieornatus]|uniref:Uncharacterized protein n=1 Tax=Ramazzottius varieornatus TaxID=947166 RepID=A0A1D1UMS7_RAMVA|nr:hypothetical protein RvY_00459-2 [Ramazzottius varieornatus]